MIQPTLSRTVLLVSVLFTSFILSCGPSVEQKRKAEDRAEAKAKDEPNYTTTGSDDNAALYDIATSVAGNAVSSSAAVENKKDTVHKFIRKAELKFKVKDVVDATYTIENITAAQGGFVTSTTLNANTDRTITTPVSADSILETTFYTVSNTMTVRVPNTQLDTTLKAIARTIDFLDYRIITAEDVALQMLSNNMTQQRAGRNEERITKAIDNKGRKLNETITAEELLSDKQEQADQSRINNMALKEQVAFSTIHLYLYQKQSVRRELIPNEKNISSYEPPFFSKLWESILFGWTIISELIVFFAKLWALVILGIIIYIIYSRYKDRIFKK